METGEVIEDVVPSVTDTKITVTVNDDEKVEIRDESLSLEEVINTNRRRVSLGRAV